MEAPASGHPPSSDMSFTKEGLEGEDGPVDILGTLAALGLSSEQCSKVQHALEEDLQSALQPVELPAAEEEAPASTSSGRAAKGGVKQQQPSTRDGQGRKLCYLGWT
jgi:hypothetical protein